MRHALLFVVLLAACSEGGVGPIPNGGVLFEGVIDTPATLVAYDVDPFREVSCQARGSAWAAIPFATGRLDTPPIDPPVGTYCVRQYHEIVEPNVIRPAHSIYIIGGPIGGQYRVHID
jgi:hypothetical protein